MRLRSGLGNINLELLEIVGLCKQYEYLIKPNNGHNLVMYEHNRYWCITNLKYCGGKLSRLNSRDYSSIFLKAQKKTTKTS
jgi:hypothetical protein